MLLRSTKVGTHTGGLVFCKQLASIAEHWNERLYFEFGPFRPRSYERVSAGNDDGGNERVPAYSLILSVMFTILNAISTN